MCDKSGLFLLRVWIVHERQGKDYIITSEVSLPLVLRYESRRLRQNMGAICYLHIVQLQPNSVAS